MSCSREATTNAFSFEFSPATKREFFQASKYSDIVGTITTSDVKTSSLVGCHFCAAASSARALRSNSRAAAT